MRILGKLFTAGLLVMLLFINGCGNTQTMESGEDAQREGTFSFIDDLGREVTVREPKRVAALIGSFTDIWLLAGGTVTAAANDSWESLHLPLGEDVVNLGSIQEPDVEKLIASQPDLVLASANTDADLEVEEILKQAGIPTAYFAVSNFEEYLHMLDICTQITGRRDLYEENGLKVQEQIKKTRERIDGSVPKVLFLRASSSSVKAKGSEGNVCGEMLSDLGCVNIADSDQTLLEDLSMEAIIAADPDYIFVTIQGNNQEAAMQNVEEMLLSNPAWSSLSAVKEGNYHLLDKRLYNLKPNAKWGEAYKGLADILYPAK
ncbi:MAG: ABC transporter substrate-binding protein [Lachnospiraceae bacterium]|nr:ABC transporter substrate-binding protein [Lachnospiraceae bacterium]MDE6185668.1 ABC transporter substrate-binding protein [Lachnospiraceae bacterium]